MKTNYERIKNMTINELARFMYDLHCQECEYRGEQWDWKKCEEKSCWCHRESGDNTYKQWLLAEESED